MYIHIYIYIHTYICIYVYTYIYTYIYRYILGHNHNCGHHGQNHTCGHRRRISIPYILIYSYPSIMYSSRVYMSLSPRPPSQRPFEWRGSRHTAHAAQCYVESVCICVYLYIT